ncbi:hypothetical protein [Pseudooceanicola marinus]|uniref:hypothetical protein n=1 Tax=Pseudooceanicola marinus TaxID=396013 RepID=UPI001E51E88B|nr:hypothetical protein [Pseudooceanicola marinus]
MDLHVPRHHVAARNDDDVALSERIELPTFSTNEEARVLEMFHGTNAERIIKAQMEEWRVTDASQGDRDQEPQRSTCRRSMSMTNAKENMSRTSTKNGVPPPVACHTTGS